MILEAVLVRGGAALEKYFRIDDPGDAQVKISPGTVLSGQIDLRHRFVDADKAFGRKDLVLFWSYQLKTRDGKPFRRVGGWLAASPSANSAPR
jgi:hypothetical protein